MHGFVQNVCDYTMMCVDNTFLLKFSRENHMFHVSLFSISSMRSLFFDLHATQFALVYLCCVN